MISDEALNAVPDAPNTRNETCVIQQWDIATDAGVTPVKSNAGNPTRLNSTMGASLERCCPSEDNDDETEPLIGVVEDDEVDGEAYRAAADDQRPQKTVDGLGRYLALATSRRRGGDATEFKSDGDVWAILWDGFPRMIQPGHCPRPPAARRTDVERVLALRRLSTPATRGDGPSRTLTFASRARAWRYVTSDWAKVLKANDPPGEAKEDAPCGGASDQCAIFQRLLGGDFCEGNLAHL